MNYSNTQISIFEALVNLMMTKNIKAITMAEVAKAANVSRGTIYMHFSDKHTLLESCIEYYIQYLFNSCPTGNGPQFASVIDTLDEKREIYKVLIAERSIPIFNQTLQANYYNRIANSSGSQIDNLQYKDAYAVFLSAGFTNLIEWWIINDKPVDKVQLLKLFEDITNKLFLK